MFPLLLFSEILFHVGRNPSPSILKSPSVNPNDKEKGHNIDGNPMPPHVDPTDQTPMPSMADRV